MTQQRFGIVEKILATSVAATTKTEGLCDSNIYRLFMDDDGTFPNNKEYPLLLYKRAFLGSQSEATQRIMESGNWTSPWVWGIFPYHHYHSTAWELLLCTQGEADIQVGGPRGPTLEVTRGDLMLIPPGLAHKQVRDAGGFTLLGSYPNNDRSAAHLGPVDTIRGSPTMKQRENIVACRLPPKDPFFGWTVDEIVLFRSSVDHLD